MLADRDRVSGDGPDEEDWENVREFRTGTRCYMCKRMANLVTDFRLMSQGKAWQEAKGCAQGKGETTKGAGMKGGGPNGWR